MFRVKVPKSQFEELRKLHDEGHFRGRVDFGEPGCIAGIVECEDVVDAGTICVLYYGELLAPRGEPQ